MKLHWSPRSPFVRKVTVLLKETGLEARVNYVRSVAAMATPNPAILADNPLSQIPTLVLDDGQPLYDSPVICEYLDGLHDGAPFFPPAGPTRWLALRRQALADGMLAVLLLWRQERMKTTAQQLPEWLAAFSLKINGSLDRLEQEADALALSSKIGGRVKRQNMECRRRNEHRRHGCGRRLRAAWPAVPDGYRRIAPCWQSCRP